MTTITLGYVLLDLLSNRDAVAIRQVEINQRNLGMQGRHELDTLRTGGGNAENAQIVLVGQQPGQAIGEHAVVVDDDDADGFAG